MKVALINPNWSFRGSIYFGCREPHLPLEFGYAKRLLEQAGHETVIIDAHLFHLSLRETRRKVMAFGPDIMVITTAPSYLFWRCAQPELRVPQELARALRPLAGSLFAVGPHGSATPGAVLRKLPVDGVFRGEFEEVLPRLADTSWRDIPGLWLAAGPVFRQALPQFGRFSDLPALHWPAGWLRRHRHHHHRFDRSPAAPGAEIESSRGCPFRCTFCAKENFRGPYRKRQLPFVLSELDGLLEQGVEYVYFIDEIFLPDQPLLEGLGKRPVQFGIQTRIDLWEPDQLAQLGRAGCVSIEAGVESVTAEGRRRLGKEDRLSSEELRQRLVSAKQHIPFVQANLVKNSGDDPGQIADWRRSLLGAGVWANDPVPLFVYPGSPAYRERWGEPDDRAWERAHADYLQQHARLSDLQETQPQSLTVMDGGRGYAT